MFSALRMSQLYVLYKSTLLQILLLLLLFYYYLLTYDGVSNSVSWRLWSAATRTLVLSTFQCCSPQGKSLHSDLKSLSLDHKVLENFQGLRILQTVCYVWSCDVHKFCYRHRAWGYGNECLTYWSPPILHLASSEQWCWSGERGILTELSLCYSIV